MKFLCPCIAAVFFLMSQKAEAENSLNLKKIGRARTVLEILEYQPDSIENWIEDRVYLHPERIEVKREGAFISDWNTSIPIPSFALDQNGVFILCSREEVNREAQAHYDRATGAFLEALGHAAAAGLNIECPPLAIYEGYKSVEAFKEWGREYSAGVERQSAGTVERNRDD
ncbi:MAG TPA: hypothetical protein VLG76_06375 [Rhabdochlamydiaceae bacterium]|nr:hypothetical protein [Rhabdochlamydiaceae bacterium]